MKISHHIHFVAALTIGAVIIVLSYLVFKHVVNLSNFISSFRISHWLSIIGTVYIAVATPAFSILKRRYTSSWGKTVSFHMFGNLIFFTLIAIHFSAQLGRPAANYPELGTGMAMSIAMSLQIVSGFMQRFRSQRPIYKRIVNPKTNKFIHASLIMVFYIAIIFHVLHGLGLT